MKKQIQNFIIKDEKLGVWTKEMIKPENLIGPFDTTEELMKSLWDDIRDIKNDKRVL